MKRIIKKSQRKLWSIITSFLFFLQRKRLIKGLTNIGVLEICFLGKNLNTDRINAGSLFFKGIIEGNTVFIKAGRGLESVENEALVGDYINSKLPQIAAHYFFSKRIGHWTVVVTEFLDESFKPLERAFREGLITLDQTIISGFCALLDELKSCNILHGDFSRRNIYIRSDGNLKLIDWGNSYCAELNNVDHFREDFWGSGLRFCERGVILDDAQGLLDTLYVLGVGSSDCAIDLSPIEKRVGLFSIMVQLR